MDEIFGERLYSSFKTPWHNKGVVSDRLLSARSAYELSGRYNVRKEPLHMADGALYTSDGVKTPVTVTPTPYYAIIRDATPDSKAEFFGAVSADYALITPDELVGIWDERLGVPVETLGALRGGSVFFVTTMLGHYEIGPTKDEVVEYLTISNAMTGREGFRMLRTPVRVVCQNTLLAAIKNAQESFTLTHNEELRRRAGDWMLEMWTSAVEKKDLLRDIAEMLAGKPMARAEAAKYVAAVYPMEERSLRPGGVRELALRAQKEHAAALEAAGKRRDHAMSLFDGAGIGLNDLPDTAWKALQAVVENEDHWPCGRWGQSYADESMLVGERARVKERAFGLAVKFCQN